MEFEFSGAKIISSQTEDGSMDRENIEKNLPKFLVSNAIGDVAYCEQVHGKDIKIIAEKGLYPNCDGLVTGDNISLFIKSADCIPLLFRSKEGMLGAIHVGRRSLLEGIINVSLKDVFEKLHLSPSDVKFFLAPHIRAKNYEVGSDLEKIIVSAGYSPFLEKIGSKTCFDLTGAAKSDLVKVGALEENIADSTIDTFEDSKFFSYRRGDRNKLFISIIHG